MTGAIEYFDVVDTNDVPTGERTVKAEAHAGNIIHRCVAVYVFDKQGNLYVQSHHSGMLDHTVGGHVSAGEDYKIAARRETEEEIGLFDCELKVVYEGLDSPEVFNPAKQQSRQHHMFGIFEAYPDESWSFVANDEVSEIVAMPLRDIVNGMQRNPTRYTPGFINTMAKFLEVKDIDIPFDVEYCRKNWGEL